MPSHTDWKIWYDDRSTFSSRNWMPDHVPIDGVQAILQWLPNDNYEIIPPADYYWWLGDRWASGGVPGLERMLRKQEPSRVILFGRWASSELYEKIMAEVHQDAQG